MKKNNMLDENEMKKLLESIPVARLATLNSDGSPYVVPVNFIYLNSNIYFHGSHEGKKMENIKRDARVCFEIDKAHGIIVKENRIDSCGVTSEYESVIAYGKASIVKDPVKKKEILQSIVRKYAPQIANREMPEEKIAVTAVIKIEILEITGKYSPSA